jgi:hypothetical protein
LRLDRGPLAPGRRALSDELRNDGVELLIAHNIKL